MIPKRRFALRPAKMPQTWILSMPSHKATVSQTSTFRILYACWSTGLSFWSVSDWLLSVTSVSRDDSLSCTADSTLKQLLGQSGAMAEQAGQQYYSQGLRQKFLLDEKKTISANPQQTYADIKYEIDEAKYKERNAKVLAAGNLATTVPSGFPEKLGGPLIWSSSDFQDENEYIIRLSKSDIEEITSALKHFKDLELEGDEVDEKSFPLPTLGPRLESASNDVYNGRGFTIVRGLDPESFSLEDYTIVYLGVSSYIAERRGKQDQRGSMLMHVMARDVTDEDPKNKDKPFHTDVVTDTLALITQQCSAEGGRSVIASAWTIYNELAATRPDILHTLAASDWPFDTYGRKPAYYSRAILYYYHEKAIMSFSRRLLVGHDPREPRTPGIPGLTEIQAEALGALHFIAEKHAIRPTMEKGDMRFINNMAILHRREAFVNSADSERHLIRVWLNNPEKCWDLPDPLKLAWARVFDDDERDVNWDIRPLRNADGRVIRAGGSCD
ncbi:Taurine hydroxylase-like protein SAT17 [Pseudocercospora fuligena]|uniref:Taurine hydroxylase-like protein SAT17 n=1 Tax=Pseudocercospora fuligena TaxID=685502 RepID=A0A8H6RN90_9PEZI|nr:Taurine hydroxylase-like protein SAT17 [Pseudocercospora fuligena]